MTKGLQLVLSGKYKKRGCNDQIDSIANIRKKLGVLLKRIPSFCCNLFMINKLQLDYKPVQLILAVNYEYIISDCDPEVWNVNTLVDNFYSWAYETGDL